DRKPVACVHVRRWNPGAAGAVGHRLSGKSRRRADHRPDRLHDAERPFAVPARPVAVPRLAAVPAGLSGVETGLRSAWLPGLDRRGLDGAADLLLPYAAATAESGGD